MQSQVFLLQLNMQTGTWETGNVLPLSLVHCIPKGKIGATPTPKIFCFSETIALCPPGPFSPIIFLNSSQCALLFWNIWLSSLALLTEFYCGLCFFSAREVNTFYVAHVLVFLILGSLLSFVIFWRRNSSKYLGKFQ